MFAGALQNSGPPTPALLSWRIGWSRARASLLDRGVRESLGVQRVKAVLQTFVLNAASRVLRHFSNDESGSASVPASMKLR